MGYSPTYLKTINNQLSAIFNYAVRYYDLKSNPCAKAGSMGKSKAEEMDFWTGEEFRKFIDSVMNKRLSYMAFMTLYWTGMRLGELLALNPKDVDLEKRTITITKSYQRLGKKDVITPPKTPKSKRVITIPEFLAADIRDYIDSFQLSGDRFQFFGRTAVTLSVCVSDLLDQALHVCIQLVNLILHGQDDCHKCFPAKIIQFFFCIYFCHGCRSPLSDVPIVTQR